MNTHVTGFQSFLSFFLHHFVLAKLATSSIRVKDVTIDLRKRLTGMAFASRRNSTHCMKMLSEGMGVGSRGGRSSGGSPSWGDWAPGERPA